MKSSMKQTPEDEVAALPWTGDDKREFCFCDVRVEQISLAVRPKSGQHNMSSSGLTF